MRKGVARLAGWAVVFTFCLSGCQRREGIPLEAADTMARLSAVCGWCHRFLAQYHRLPSGDAEFREFVKKIPAKDLIVSPEELDRFLVSPRDHQSFVIRYQIQVGSREGVAAAGEGPVIAHEQEGFQGRRAVVYFYSGRSELVDEARFRELTR